MPFEVRIPQALQACSDGAKGSQEVQI